jgi:alpha-glucosidase
MLTRWIEVGAFNPIFRDHYDFGKRPQEVWVDGPEHEAIRRRYIEERYRLLPYIYGLAEENSRTGLPILRPVFLEYPGTLGADWQTSGAPEHFMLGGDLLIAPPVVWESPGPYKIALPGAGWFDYWTGLRLDQSQLTETPRLDRLPVFVRPGSILVKQPLVQSTAETPNGPLAVHVYPGGQCEGYVYLDDGVSFAYRRGEFLRQEFTCTAGSSSLDVAFAQRTGKFKPWWTQVSVVVHGWTCAAAASLDGKPLTVQYDGPANTLTMTLPDQPRPAHLRISSAEPCKPG